MTTFRIIDCETTGIDEDAKIVEVASIDMNVADDGISHEIVNAMQTLVNPGIAIPPQAMAIHHITDEMVVGAPKYGEVFDDFRGAEYYVAHNSRFDQRYLSSFNKPWIDTYRCALVAWPDAPAHSNAVLFYWLRQQTGDASMPPESAGGHHRALFDVHMTAKIFQSLIFNVGMSVDQMLEISNQPALLPKMNFGKHRGEKFADLPIGYLKWMQTQSFDADIKHTVKTELDRRNGKAVIG